MCLFVLGGTVWGFAAPHPPPPRAHAPAVLLAAHGYIAVRGSRAHGGHGRPALRAGRGVPALERSRVLSGSCEGLEGPFPASVCLGSGESRGGAFVVVLCYALCSVLRGITVLSSFLA